MDCFEPLFDSFYVSIEPLFELVSNLGIDMMNVGSDYPILLENDSELILGEILVHLEVLDNLLWVS